MARNTSWGDTGDHALHRAHSDLFCFRWSLTRRDDHYVDRQPSRLNPRFRSMPGLGARLAARARELGLSNAEVARRAGLSERRFGNYVTDTREPDLHTLTILAR